MLPDAGEEDGLCRNQGSGAHAVPEVSICWHDAGVEDVGLTVKSGLPSETQVASWSLPMFAASPHRVTIDRPLKGVVIAPMSLPFRQTTSAVLPVHQI